MYKAPFLPAFQKDQLNNDKPSKTFVAIDEKPDEGQSGKRSFKTPATLDTEVNRISDTAKE